nr:hypothetical protein [Micromonospora cremea]
MITPTPSSTSSPTCRAASRWASTSHLRYVTEFVTALNGCADHCTFHDFCGGAQAGNRYFEHATFTARETTYCRTTRQALVRATADHLIPEGGP